MISHHDNINCRFRCDNGVSHHEMVLIIVKDDALCVAECVLNVKHHGSDRYDHEDESEHYHYLCVDQSGSVLDEFMDLNEYDHHH